MAEWERPVDTGLSDRRLVFDLAMRNKAGGSFHRPHTVLSTRKNLGRIGRDRRASRLTANVDYILRQGNWIVGDRRIYNNRIRRVVIQNHEVGHYTRW